MKTVAMIAAAFLSMTAAANAGSGIKVERPCGSRCAAPQPAAQVRVSDFYATCCEIGTVRFVELKKSEPSYQARSTTVIQSRFGTSVIDSVYRGW